MQRVEAAPAFLLHTQPYRETSLLLDAFTRDHGRIGVVARGVRGARAQARRAVLQPFQPVLLDWQARGELGALAGVDAAGPALLPRGDALIAGFYVNELCQRLLVRGEACPALFGRYVETLAALVDGEAVAWALRRFERDLLAELGYALVLSEADSGRVLEPAQHYHYHEGEGPQPARRPMPGTVSGRALAALAEDTAPDAEALRELRGLMRARIAALLGGRELRAWRLLDGLRRLSVDG